jgi:hypothetical protein
MMKTNWVPAALMGCLGLGYLAGLVGRGSCDETSRPAETRPVAAPPLAAPPSPVVEAPEAEPPPLPDPASSDGLGEYPPWNGKDLDCDDVRRRVRVSGPDPHKLDNDGNGIGCESY